MAQFTEFGKEISKRLIDIERPQGWLCSGFFYKIAETKKRRRKNGRGNRNGKNGDE